MTRMSVYRSLLRQCALACLSGEEGRKLHAMAITSGLSALDPFTQNAILHMYAMCGNVLFARQVFEQILHKDVVNWTTLMTGYARNRLPGETLKLFRTMELGDDVKPDQVTMVIVFGACSQLGDGISGMSAHCYMIKKGLPFTTTACNAAMDMYAKCQRMGDARQMFDEMGIPTLVSWTIILTGALKWEGIKSARQVFDRMPQMNEVSWTVMVTGYVESGCPREGFSLLQQMLLPSSLGDDAVVLNPVTLCSLLSACSQSGDLTMGRWVHLYSVKNFHCHQQMDVMVGTATVDMYAKCGRVDTAWLVFERMKERNVVTWNAMLSGLAMHGCGSAALRLFSQMQSVGVEADDITFVGVLSACSHSGLLKEGWEHFHNLQIVHGITPKVEHYACMVDLLGRAGHVEEAERLVREMPIPPNDVVLGSLLASCKLHGKLELGERLLDQLLQIDPYNTDYHVLLSNMYATTIRTWDKGSDVRNMLKKRGIDKAPGRSSIHIHGEIHYFTAGDKSHPRSSEIYAMLDEMVRKLRLAGYVPNTTSQVCIFNDDVDEQEEKEQALFAHSERLAIAFGLISTAPGLPIHIIKNLRICGDCHSAAKLISCVFHREIIIRDRNRFHCFKLGSCSCSDYW